MLPPLGSNETVQGRLSKHRARSSAEVSGAEYCRQRNFAQFTLAGARFQADYHHPNYMDFQIFWAPPDG